MIKPGFLFLFLNDTVENPEFLETMKIEEALAGVQVQIHGDPMYVLWTDWSKLKMIQLRKLQKPFTQIVDKLEKARNGLEKVQKEVALRTFDRKLLEEEECVCMN